MLEILSAVFVGLFLGTVFTEIVWKFEDKYGYKEEDGIEY